MTVSSGPPALHCMVTPRHAGVVDAYLSDLGAAVEMVRSNPHLAAKGSAAMYGMIANVALRDMIKSEVAAMMDGLYGPECKMPAMMDGFVPAQPRVKRHARSEKKALKPASAQAGNRGARKRIRKRDTR